MYTRVICIVLFFVFIVLVYIRYSFATVFGKSSYKTYIFFVENIFTMICCHCTSLHNVNLKFAGIICYSEFSPSGNIGSYSVAVLYISRATFIYEPHGEEETGHWVGKWPNIPLQILSCNLFNVMFPFQDRQSSNVLRVKICHRQMCE